MGRKKVYSDSQKYNQVARQHHCGECRWFAKGWPTETIGQCTDSFVNLKQEDYDDEGLEVLEWQLANRIVYEYQQACDDFNHIPNRFSKETQLEALNKSRRLIQ